MVRLWTAAATCWLAAAAHAEIPFDVQQISPHVWTARPARTPRINSTSTVIVGDAGLVVVEAQADPQLARQLIREIRAKISKQPVLMLILTHAHLDHVLGAQSFMQEFPGLRIVAHANARDAIERDGDRERREWLTVLEAALAKMPASDAQHDELAAYVAAVRDARVVRPQALEADSATIDFGTVVEVRYLGRGHTDGDLVVSVPGDRVLIAGDLAHDFEPLFQSAYPRDWLATLRKLQALPFDILIGGHGNAQRGRATLDAWTKYVALMVAEISSAKGRGRTLEQSRDRIVADFMTWLKEDGNGARIQRAREAAMTPWLIGPLEDAVRGGVDTAWRRLDD